jgi:hypothetical protein
MAVQSNVVHLDEYRERLRPETANTETFFQPAFAAMMPPQMFVPSVWVPVVFFPQIPSPEALSEA